MASGCPGLEELRLKRMLVTDDYLDFLSLSIGRLQALVIVGCKGFSTDGLFFVAMRCRFLKELDLQRTKVTDCGSHWLSRFPYPCTSLMSLNISCMWEVDYLSLQSLIDRSPNLRSLWVNRCMPSHALPRILATAPQLVDLGTVAIEPPQLTSSLVHAFQNCKCIRRFSVLWSVASNYLHVIYSICQKLTDLNLSGAIRLQASEITKIVRYC